MAAAKLGVRTVVVTGSNRGLGYGLVENILRRTASNSAAQ
jgi:NAD(P)-dependent dehydrogenase (short-subunit alcohol dehydrogenase family)